MTENKQKITTSNNEVVLFPSTRGDAVGEDPSSDSSGIGEGGFAGI